MIRDALMTGEHRSPAAFLRHNREVVASIEALADRARRRDLMVDEQAIYAFYDKRVPADVWSGSRFESWRKKVEHDDPRALFLDQSDILLGDAAAVSRDQFPDALDLGELRLPLSYRYEPGHEEDGITVTVPLAALGELDRAPFEWLVPGFLVEKATALLESLPKAIRKNFVPVREAAVRFAGETQRAAESQRAHDSLASALSRFLEKEKATSVPTGAFSAAAGPEYLRMLFRVVDEQGRPIATSRDLGELQQRLGLRARQSFGQASKGTWERDRVTAWDFGDLPERVEIRHGSFNLPGYPALSAEKEGVALRVFQHAGEAAASHRRGLRRLFALRLGETIKHVRRNLPGFQAMSIQFAMVSHADALRDDIVGAAIDRICLGDGAPPRAKEAFERRADEARGKVAAVADEVCAKVAPILGQYQEIARILAQSATAASDPPWKGIREHVGRLVYAGFISETPPKQLAHLERYLKAVRLRIERLRQSPAKDRARELELWPHWQAYIARADDVEAHGTRSEALERYRWLLEEWRVSLFAQELRTAEPVSVRKISDQWEKVRAEANR
jgi:ATP-dependent helicase HrpA